MTLRCIPCSRAQAHAFIALHHRHHKPPVGEVFRVACVDGAGLVRGVATVGRPVSRHLDDGWTLEVTRVATDGVRNGCSLLYGAVRRAAWALGYRTVYTYTLLAEGGASLRAAGWVCDGQTGTGIGWSRRPGRLDNHPDPKTRWVTRNPKAFAGEPAWPEPKPEPLPLLAGVGSGD
jgi:hypothetical protein